MLRKILLTILISGWVPINLGTAQDRRNLSDTVLENTVLRKEVDSIRSQINLNLDLIKYKIEKDSLNKTKPNEKDTIL